MKDLLSVWMTFSKEDELYLQKIIVALGKEYGAPVFRPHLTIYGGSPSETMQGKEAVIKAIVGIKPFEVYLEKLDFTDDFFKTVFISLFDHPLLSHISWDLKQSLEPASGYSFKPHISLIYKELSTEKKQEIIKKLNIKESFTVQKITVSIPGSGKKDWRDIASWQTLFEKDLNDS